MIKIGIVADCAPFSSIEQAAFAENQIDWWNTQAPEIRGCVESWAAVELKQHLKKILAASGRNTEVLLLSPSEARQTDIEMYIWVGSTSIPEEIRKIYASAAAGKPGDREGYVIACLRTEAAHWILDGASAHGTLYAAYSLLEKWGIRWYGAGEKNLCVPVIRDEEELIHCGEVTADAPKFKTRGVYSEFIDDSNEEAIFWAARMRANFFFGDEIHNPHRMKKLGFGLVAGGHIIQRDYLNPAVYQHEHPEWYGLVDGKRHFEFGKDCVEGYNFCTSNQEAVNTLCSNVVRSLADGKLKHADYLNFWMLDMGKWCQCEACKASGNYTSRLISVVTRLREKITESQRTGRLKRQVRILFPAYLETLQPPDQEIPRGFDYDNCLPTFFPIERCYLHNIDDSRCTETNADIMRAFRPWALDEDRRYRGALFLGEYFNVSPFANLPFQFTSVLSHDLPYYYEAGIRHFYFFHFPIGELGPLRLTNYLVYKMLWDPYLDTEGLLDEYFRVFYLNASHIRQVYRLLEEASKNAKYFKQFQLRDGQRLSLNEKLEVLNEDLFPMKHMQLDSVDEGQGGVSFYQMAEKIQQARLEMNRALFTQSGLILQRMLEDQRRFDYLEQMTFFLFYFSLARIAYGSGRVEQARVYYGQATVYAQQLEKNTKAAVTSKPFWLYENGLMASWCATGYRKLGEMLEQ